MLGEKIRKFRKEKALTLKEVAEATGLSIGYISQLERGAIEPSLASLRKISDALKISLYALMDRKEEGALEIKKERRPIIKFHSSEIFYELVSPVATAGYSPASMVVQFEIEKGGCDSEDFLSHESEEIVVMLEGCMDMILGETVYHLKKGDSLLIKPHTLHRTINTGDVPAVGLCILTPMTMSL